jgi:phosphoenolpyruvate carboxylase
MKAVLPSTAQAGTALALVTLLNELARAHPAYSRFLSEAAEKVRRQSERSPQEDARLILAAVREGYSTVAEIEEETRIPRAEIYPLLAALVHAGTVEVSRRITGQPGHGGQRHHNLYFLKDEG